MAANAVAAWGLRSRRLVEIPRLTDQQFDEILRAVEDHRLVGLLGEAADSLFDLTEGQVERLELLLMRWQGHSLLVERMALQTVELLERSGVPVRCVKGVALARLAYPEVCWRVFGDVDVLVPRPLLSASAQLLEERLGGERVLPEIRQGFDARFGRSITIRVGAFEIDVHATLADGPYGHLVRTEDLFRNPRAMLIGDREVATLDPVQTLLCACFVALLGDCPPRLMAQRDLVQLALEDSVSITDLVAEAGRWRSTAVVARAISAAWHHLDLEDPCELSEWASSIRSTGRDRLLLWTYHGGGRGYRSHLASTAVIDGWRNRMDYLRAIAHPDQGYLAARHVSQLGWLARIGRR